MKKLIKKKKNLKNKHDILEEEHKNLIKSIGDYETDKEDLYLTIILPALLDTLICGLNYIVSLPKLPNSLLLLSCNTDSLTSLPVLPNSLKFIDCSYNKLGSLPALPASLTRLQCYTNHLIGLPALPDSLAFLGCGWNQLTTLPILPNTLEFLDCRYNKINKLPILPQTLNNLNCFSNNITCFLPFSTNYISLIINNNPISCLPNYVAAMGTDTSFYNLCEAGECTVSTDITIPNVFTPNGDGINDEFLVKASNLANFSCSIYNSWGILMYQWSNVNTGWNGKDKSGAASTDGTYFYVISYTDNTGKTNSKNGFFQLLR